MCKSLTRKASATILTLSDLASSRVDYVGAVRDNTGNFFRSVYIKDACINSLNYSYDVNGNAVEGYELLGDNLTVFDGYVITKTYTVTAIDVSNGYFTLPLTGPEIPVRTKQNSYFNNSYLLRVSKVSGDYASSMTEGNDYRYDPDTKHISASGLAAGQVWTIVFYSVQTSAPIIAEFNPTSPAAIRGEFTPISIGVKSKTLIPRVQSAKLSINLGQKRVSQLGSSQVIFAPNRAPGISGDLKVLMSDLNLRKLLTYGIADSSEIQFGIEQMSEYGVQNNLGFEVVVKSPVNGSVLKRISIPDIFIAASGIPTSVNGNLMESFTWTGKSGIMTIANS